MQSGVERQKTYLNHGTTECLHTLHTILQSEPPNEQALSPTGFPGRDDSAENSR